MNKTDNDNYFILTGAMGAGKSTVLRELRKLSITCVNEPARQILAEQRMIQGDGIPGKNNTLFTNLLLSRSINEFNHMQDYHSPIIFDRGIPDNIAYAQLFDLDSEIYFNASHQYRYNKRVFFLPAWPDIYENNDERKMSYEQAKQFCDSVKKIYETLDYDIIEVPIDTPFARAEFILNSLDEVK